MKVLYATSVHYPSKLANPEQIVATVRELNRLSNNAWLLGLCSVAQPLPFPHRVFAGSKKSLALGWRYATFAKQHGFTHIYCREERLLFFIMLYCKLLRYTPQFFYEAHTIPKGFVFEWVVKRVDGVVAITHMLKNDLSAFVPSGAIAVAPDGVDVGVFARAESKEAARIRLGVPEEGRVVMYIGQLGGWKGVETLLEASRLLPNTTVLIIGGEAEQIAPLAQLYPQVHFFGRRPYQELHHNQVAADVLVLPNTARDKTSVKYTSPLKLFSYMASGVPIVASDLPSLREVVSEEEVFFFEPDNPRALAAAIEHVCADTAEAQARAERALELVKHYTWENRARAILDFVT